MGKWQEQEASCPTVSVVIPTHNRANMLRRAIGSVLAQTYQDFEVIVVSDASTDNTEEVVASCSDPRIRLLKHRSARGASAARNTGLRGANGQYIAFLDDDDEWMPTKLEAQLTIIRHSPPQVGLVYCWMDYVHEGKVLNTRCPTLRGDIFSEMLDKQAITNSSTLLIRREVLNIVKGFDETLPRGNDGDFIRRTAKHFEVDYVPNVLCKVHVGHGDRISVKSRKNILHAIKAEKARLARFKEDYEKNKRASSNMLFKIGTSYILIGMRRKGLSHMLKAICKDPSNHRLYFGVPKALVASMFRPSELRKSDM